MLWENSILNLVNDLGNTLNINGGILLLEYSMDINDTQANYRFLVKIVEEGGGQASNYVGTKFFNDALNKNILVKTDIWGYPRDQDDVYILNEEYKFKLGHEVLDLIGDEYDTYTNKFIISYPNTTDGKPQLNRRAYKKLSEIYDDGFNWFVELYDKNISGNKLLITVDEDEKLLTLDVEFSSIKKFITFKSKSPVKDIPCTHNRIVFGAPGTGKSFQLEKDRKEYFGNRYIRVTFHPNYSYSHFVGTYKPVPEKFEDDEGNEKEEITYKYVPGPFMKAFVESVNNLDEPFLLLIEEINRANVAAVFGDVFQLLDRKDGESEYEIQTSNDMKDYLDGKIDDENFDTERIRIPSNMYIWATMNSADQGVFPMDTAFKRRWDFTYIGINGNDNEMKDIFVKVGEDEKEICWNDLRIAINNKLSNKCHINEDKLLGPYFLSKDLLKSEKVVIKEEGVSKERLFVKNNNKFIDAFKNKVLMYLYEDVAKQQHIRSELFSGCDDYSKFSSLCKEFDEKGEEIFGKGFIKEYSDK